MNHVTKLAIAIFAVAAAATAEAGSISGCVGASSKCTLAGTDYFCETACSGGTCTNIPTSDVCPGHCLTTPWITCATDAPCNGSGNTCQGSGTMSVCIAGSDRAGDVCYNQGDCNDPRGGLCTVGGVNCCSGGGGPAYLGDGALTVCGSNSSSSGDVITLGTPPSGKRYAVCGRNGNDTINGGDGEDIIDGGDGDDTITGGYGTDTIYGGDGNDDVTVSPPPYYLSGNDFVDGGAGDDTITGSNRLFIFGVYVEGDNTLLGGDGNDTIISGTGRDVIKGGSGVDTVWNAVYGTVPDDVVGSLLCGGDGNDDLIGYGPSHQCFDGGAGTDACTYAYNSSGTQSAEDLGTVKSCETVTGSVSSRVVGCGCE